VEFSIAKSSESNAAEFQFAFLHTLGRDPPFLIGNRVIGGY
jgi:hypothetical protein